MITRHIHLRTVSLAGAVLALAALATVTLNGRVYGATPTPPVSTFGPLQTIGQQALAGGRIKLTAVTAQQRSSTTTTAAEAAQTAKLHSPEGAVVESALVNFEDDLSTKPFKCLCWVVARTLPNGPFITGVAPIPGETYRPPPTPVDPFHIDVIDAATGAYIYSAEGSR